MIDLTLFCADSEDIRHYLQKPWREPGTICASNSHIAIEIVDDGRCLEDNVGHPNVSKVLSKTPITTDFVPLPELPPVEQCEPCSRCKGEGFHFGVSCDDCNGDGAFGRGRWTYTCKECDGDGLIGDEEKRTRCLLCEGYGSRGDNYAHLTPVGPATFQTRYLRAFAGLPGVQVSHGGAADMLHIRFDGGRGGVMPTRRPEAANQPGAAP